MRKTKMTNSKTEGIKSEMKRHSLVDIFFRIFLPFLSLSLSLSLWGRTRESTKSEAPKKTGETGRKNLVDTSSTREDYLFSVSLLAWRFI